MLLVECLKNDHIFVVRCLIFDHAMPDVFSGFFRIWLLEGFLRLFVVSDFQPYLKGLVSDFRPYLTCRATSSKN